MQIEKNNYKRIETSIYELCEEIDELRYIVNYWKKMYEDERDLNIKATNESIESARRGVGQALMFALSVRENEEGDLIIPKEDRKQLAKGFETTKK